MPSAWINHAKEFAKSKGMSYMNALKSAECKASYKEGKGGEIKPAVMPNPNIEMVLEELPAKKGRGRPKKYSSPEEAKKAKSAKTMESNKRKKVGELVEGKGIPNPLVASILDNKTPLKPIKIPRVPRVPKLKAPLKAIEGEGLNVGYKVEGHNGLAHIYPISHDLVLQMLSCCPK